MRAAPTQPGPAARRGPARPASRRAALLVGVVLLIAAVAVTVLRPAEPATLDQRAQAVAETLRCPACQAESVADSATPTARGMRAIIHAQLAEGASPEEVRAYFVDRYGQSVLLEPPRTGAGAVLWLTAFGALVVGVAAAVWVVARRRPGGAVSAGGADGATASPPTATPAPADKPGFRRTGTARAGLSVAAVATVSVVAAWLVIAAVTEALIPRTPGAPATGGEPPNAAADTSDVLTGRALEQAGDLEAAAEVYRAELARHPDHVDAAFRLGFVLARLDRPAEAEPVLGHVVALHPDLPDALLLLGTVQRQLGRDEATGTLRRFLEVAPPQHPARQHVQRLLEEQR